MSTTLAGTTLSAHHPQSPLGGHHFEGLRFVRQKPGHQFLIVRAEARESSPDGRVAQVRKDAKRKRYVFFQEALVSVTIPVVSWASDVKACPA